MKLTVTQRSFPLKAPFAITGYVFNNTETVQVALEAEGQPGQGERGRGEGVGVYYNNDTVALMTEQLASVRGDIHAGITREDVLAMLPAGGARNALDCALWDLQAKSAGKSIWQCLDLTPKPLTTVCTIGIGSPDEMAETARRYSQYSHLKIKLSNLDPIARLEAIRAVRPDAHLIIDVNQGWTFEELQEYLPAVQKLNIAMVEQPLPRGEDEALEGFKSPVPLGADESCLDTSEYETAARRYDVINIKLDKCGGLTEALRLVALAKRDNKALMVGNMTGTSLSMAPAFVVGQYCQFVDIDGPLLLARDVDHPLQYQAGGIVSPPAPELWG